MWSTYLVGDLGLLALLGAGASLHDNERKHLSLLLVTAGADGDGTAVAAFQRCGWEGARVSSGGRRWQQSGSVDGAYLGGSHCVRWYEGAVAKKLDILRLGSLGLG